MDSNLRPRQLPSWSFIACLGHQSSPGETLHVLLALCYLLFFVAGVPDVYPCPPNDSAMRAQAIQIADGRRSALGLQRRIAAVVAMLLIGPGSMYPHECSPQRAAIQALLMW